MAETGTYVQYEGTRRAALHLFCFVWDEAKQSRGSVVGLFKKILTVAATGAESIHQTFGKK